MVDPALAEAILYRRIRHACKINVKAGSMRKKKIGVDTTTRFQVTIKSFAALRSEPVAPGPW
jgi:hypothetical protein